MYVCTCTALVKGHHSYCSIQLVVDMLVGHVYGRSLWTTRSVEEVPV